MNYMLDFLMDASDLRNVLTPTGFLCWCCTDLLGTGVVWKVRHVGAGKTLISLCSHTISPESSLCAYTIY